MSQIEKLREAHARSQIRTAEQLREIFSSYDRCAYVIYGNQRNSNLVREVRRLGISPQEVFTDEELINYVDQTRTTQIMRDPNLQAIILNRDLEDKLKLKYHFPLLGKNKDPQKRRSEKVIPRF
jgi:hypothetical protein